MIEPLTLQAMAALMRQGRKIAAVSWLLAATALAWVLLVALVCRGQSLPAFIAIVLSLAAGLAQLWHAVRVDFDARLFAALATQVDDDDRSVQFDASVPSHQAAGDTAARAGATISSRSAGATARLDATLLELGLVAPAAAGRDWPTRWCGARRLLHRQFAWLALQALALAAGLAFSKEATTCWNG